MKVVPEALRYEARAVTEAAAYWDQAKKDVEGHPMAENALGSLLPAIPELFNRVAKDVGTHFGKGKQTIRSAGEGLGNCATVYEQKDLEWYRQFGYED